MTQTADTTDPTAAGLTRFTPTEPVRQADAPSTRRTVSNRWLAWFTTLMVLGGLVAGVAGGMLISPTYGARAEILYPITEELPTGFLREDRNLTTQLVLLESRAVLRPVAEAEGVSLADLEKSVNVTLLDSSEVIRIEVRDASATMAVSLAESIADTYLETIRAIPDSRALQYVEAELEDVREVLAEARDELRTLREQEAAGTDSAGAVDEARGVVADLRTRARALQRERDDIQIIELSAPPAVLVTQAYELDSPVSPGPVLLGFAGALTGLVVAAGVGAILLRQRFRA
jgi:uncharacterized protein involved in exopolysaccharide biosynthesis